MAEAQFYFLSDQYYLDFPDDKLMKNKVMVDGSLHKRPCFFAFRDRKIPEIYWIVPISSRYEKYKQIEHIKKKNMGAAILFVLEWYSEEIQLSYFRICVRRLTNTLRHTQTRMRTQSESTSVWQLMLPRTH